MGRWPREVYWWMLQLINLINVWCFYYLKDNRIYPIVSASPAEIHGKESKVWTPWQPPPELNIPLSKSCRGPSKCGEPGNPCASQSFPEASTFRFFLQKWINLVCLCQFFFLEPLEQKKLLEFFIWCNSQKENKGNFPRAFLFMKSDLSAFLKYLPIKTLFLWKTAQI